MEAFHWRYHPLAARVLEIIGSGDLGAVRRVEARFAFPLLKRSDIRWDLGLAGGALMDAGCYAVHIVRTLAGAEPTVVHAGMREHSPGVDRAAWAELAFPDGATGGVRCSMRDVPRVGTTVVGEAATLKVINPLAPQVWNRITVKGRTGSRHERVAGGPTYGFQLAAFTAAVRDGTPTLTPPSDSIATMRVIDAIYRAAGLEVRAPTPA